MLMRVLPSCRRSFGIGPLAGSDLAIGDRPLDPGLDRVEPADDRVQPEQLGVDRESEAQVALGPGVLDPGPLLHELRRGSAGASGSPRRRRCRAAGSPSAPSSRARPVAERSGRVACAARSASSAVPVAVIWKTFCGPVVGAFGLDQPVALQPLQGRIDLAHVQRPHLACPGLELLPKLQAVLRPLAQQSEQGVPDAHDDERISIMRSSIRRSVQGASVGNNRIDLGTARAPAN